MPRLSLIMSTYNDAPYLPLALDSLLAQTYSDFELILIDDGAEDETPQILAPYKDARLKYHRNPHNLGLSKSLNRGLDLATGELIGRMDADDIATPATRLADQVAYLDSHPHIGLLSGDMVSIGGGGQAHYGMAGTHSFLKWRLLWQNPISHITVMLRRAILEHNRYDPEFNNAEDYDLWARLSHQTQFYRSEQVWAYRRIRSTSVTQRHFERQMALTQVIMRREQKHLLGFEADDAIMRTLMNLIYANGEAVEIQRTVDFLLHAHEVLQAQLDPPAQLQVQNDLVVWLYRLANRAPTGASSRYSLRALRQISPRQFYTWRTLQRYMAGFRQNN